MPQPLRKSFQKSAASGGKPRRFTFSLSGVAVAALGLVLVAAVGWAFFMGFMVGRGQNPEKSVEQMTGMLRDEQMQPAAPAPQTAPAAPGAQSAPTAQPERAEQPEGPAGLRTVLSDRPLEGDEASTLSWLLWAGRQGRAVPRERSLGRPEAGAGTVPEIRGEERASLWETEGVAGTRRLQAAMELARRAAGYRREPRADRAGPVSLRPGSDEPLLREHDSARTVDRIFRRDARRYDGGFALF